MDLSSLSFLVCPAIIIMMLVIARLLFTLFDYSREPGEVGQSSNFGQKLGWIVILSLLCLGLGAIGIMSLFTP